MECRPGATSYECPRPSSAENMCNVAAKGGFGIILVRYGHLVSPSVNMTLWYRVTLYHSALVTERDINPGLVVITPLVSSSRLISLRSLFVYQVKVCVELRLKSVNKHQGLTCTDCLFTSIIKSFHRSLYRLLPVSQTTGFHIHKLCTLTTGLTTVPYNHTEYNKYIIIMKVIISSWVC